MARNMYRKRIGEIFSDYKIFGYEENAGSGWIEFGVVDRELSLLSVGTNLSHLERLGFVLGTGNIEVEGLVDSESGEHYLWITAYDVNFAGGAK